MRFGETSKCPNVQTSKRPNSGCDASRRHIWAFGRFSPRDNVLGDVVAIRFPVMNEQTTQAETAGYTANATYVAIADRVRSVHRIAVVSHSKPDGDAIGSMLALKRALESIDKQVDIFLMGPLESNLLLVAGDTPWHRVEDHPPSDDYEAILVVDTGSWSQLEPLETWLKKHRDRIIGLDHHTGGDPDVAPMRLIDPTMASTTQLLVPLLDELGCPLTGGLDSVAEALFVGLATDTGWFRHNNAGADVFSVAVRLLARGVDKSRLYQIIEETHRPERLALEARALNSLQYARDGTVAIMSIAREDFEQTGGSTEDLTGVVNMPMIVGKVRVSVLITQSEPNITKLSFRSKPPLPGFDDDDYIDVNDIAKAFGGGGHVHAAGARVNAEIDEAVESVRNAVEQV